MHQPPQCHDREHQHRQHAVKERDVVLELETRDARTVNVEQAILTTGDGVGLHRDEPEHLTASDGE
jgi:hypothetical protein